MVDYSKWNNFAANDSDSDHDHDDDDYEDNSFDPSKPSVMQLEPNTRVEINPSGTTFKSSKEINMNTDIKTKENSSSSSLITKTKTKSTSTSVLENKGDIFTWQQTKDEVILRINIPNHFLELLKTRKSNIIQLTCLSKKFILKIGTEVIIDRELAYQVIETDKEGDSCIDWEIITTSVENKEILVTMKKNSPIPNAIQWWSKVFVTDTHEIDVTKIVGRKVNTDNQTIWRQAHEKFLETVAKKEKVDVDVDVDVDMGLSTNTGTGNDNDSDSGMVDPSLLVDNPKVEEVP